MSRRDQARRHARGGGGASAASALSLIGATGFAPSTAYYTTTNPGGYAGVGTGFYCGVFTKLTTQAVSSANRFVVASEATGTGYHIYTETTYATLFARAYNGVGTICRTPGYTIVAGDLNKVMAVMMVHDGNVLYLYVNGALVGSVACVGFSPASSAWTLGTRSASLAQAWDNGAVVYGAVAGPGAPTLANVQAWGAAGKTAYAVTAVPTFTPAELVSFTSPIGATLVATYGDNLSRVGTPTQVTETNPTWGF